MWILNGLYPPNFFFLAAILERAFRGVVPYSNATPSLKLEKAPPNANKEKKRDFFFTPLLGPPSWAELG